MADSMLTREYAHLPVWAWGLIGGGGLYLLVQLYKKHQTGAQQAATAPTAATGASTGGGQPNSIFFLPNNAPQPSQVGVNFNSRPKPAAQQITSTYVTPSSMYSPQIAQAVYKIAAGDSVSAAVETESIIEANPQLDWSRPIPKGTTINVPAGVGTRS